MTGSAIVVVPVESLASHEQLFRCAPYRVTLTARACVMRQERMASGQADYGDRMRLRLCVGCSLGAAVRERVGDADEGRPAGMAAPAPTAPKSKPRRGAVMRASIEGSRRAHLARQEPPVAPVEDAPPIEDAASPPPEEPRIMSTPAPCKSPGCTGLAGKAHANTNPDHAPLCAEHRRRARNAETEARRKQARERAVEEGLAEAPSTASPKSRAVAAVPKKGGAVAGKRRPQHSPGYAVRHVTGVTSVVTGCLPLSTLESLTVDVGTHTVSVARLRDFYVRVCAAVGDA